MKHLKFGIPSTKAEEVSFAPVQPISIDTSGLEQLFELADGLESIFNGFRDNGVSRQSFSKMTDLMPAMECVDNRMFSSAPSIRGLHFALEANVSERKGILSKIVGFFSDLFNKFVAYITERYAAIKAWYTKTISKKFKLNSKVLNFIPKIFKNKEAFTKAVMATATPDTAGDKNTNKGATPAPLKDAPATADDITKLVEECQAMIAESFKKVNENLYVKYTFFNFEGVEQFLNGFDRYALDFDRIHGVIAVLNNAMSTNDAVGAYSALKSCEATIKDRLPNSEWFTKRALRVNDYSKKDIDLTDSRFTDFAGKVVNMIETNTVIKNSDKAVSDFTKLNNTLKKGFLETVKGSFDKLETEKANGCEILTRSVLNDLIEVVASIQREYVAAAQISMGLIVFHDFVNVTFVNHAAKMQALIIEALGANSEATATFVQNSTGIDPSAATESINDINDGIAVNYNIGLESLSGSAYSQLDNAAMGLESLFDPDMDKLARNVLTHSGIFAIANEASNQQKPGILKILGKYFVQLFKRFKDFIVKRLGLIKFRKMVYTKQEINIAKIIDSEKTPERIAKFFSNLFKDDIEEKSQNEISAIVKQAHAKMVAKHEENMKKLETNKYVCLFIVSLQYLDNVSEFISVLDETVIAIKELIEDINNTKDGGNNEQSIIEKSDSVGSCIKIILKVLTDKIITTPPYLEKYNEAMRLAEKRGANTAFNITAALKNAAILKDPSTANLLNKLANTIKEMSNKIDFKENKTTENSENYNETLVQAQSLCNEALGILITALNDYLLMINASDKIYELLNDIHVVIGDAITDMLEVAKKHNSRKLILRLESLLGIYGYSSSDKYNKSTAVESLNYNSFDELDSAAVALESMFDCDIVHHYNDCRNMAGVFAIANEANEEVKKGYIARFIGWLREFFGRIIDYVVNLCKALKAHFKPLTNIEIKVAARVTAMGPSAEDIAKTIADTVKDHIDNTPNEPSPAVAKLADAVHVERIFEAKVGDFFKKVEENAHFYHVLTEPKKVIMFINSINNFHPLSLEFATAIHNSINADADSDVLDRQCDALETAMSNFISKTSKKLIKKDTALSSFNATFEEMFDTMESKNDKNDYNLSEAIELVKEVNVVKNKGLLDDFLKELNKIITSFNSAHNGVATANKLNGLIMDCASFLKQYMNVYYSFLMSADLVHKHISNIVEIFEDIVSKIPEDDRVNKNLAHKLRQEMGIG